MQRASAAVSFRERFFGQHRPVERREAALALEGGKARPLRVGGERQQPGQITIDSRPNDPDHARRAERGRCVTPFVLEKRAQVLPIDLGRGSGGSRGRVRPGGGGRGKGQEKGRSSLGGGAVARRG